MSLDTEKIRELMKKKEKTQQQIADAMGMSQPSFAAVLSGKFDPKLSTIERIANALGVNVATILKKD